jgi:hypothetical protein
MTWSSWAWYTLKSASGPATACNIRKYISITSFIYKEYTGSQQDAKHRRCVMKCKFVVFETSYVISWYLKHHNALCSILACDYTGPDAQGTQHCRCIRDGTSLHMSSWCLVEMTVTWCVLFADAHDVMPFLCHSQLVCCHQVQGLLSHCRPARHLACTCTDDGIKVSAVHTPSCFVSPTSITSYKDLAWQADAKCKPQPLQC